MQFSIATLATLSASLVPALAQTNITLSATFADGTSTDIAALHEGAGFSYLFNYTKAVPYSIDFQTGLIYTPLSEGLKMVLDINSGIIDIDDDSMHPITLAGGNESSVFWFLDRPTGGASRLNALVKGEGALVKFYAGQNFTYDPYQYSTHGSYFIGGSPLDLDYLTKEGVTSAQEVELWATVSQ